MYKRQAFAVTPTDRPVVENADADSNRASIPPSETEPQVKYTTRVDNADVYKRQSKAHEKEFLMFRRRGFELPQLTKNGQRWQIGEPNATFPRRDVYKRQRLGQNM